MTTLKQKRVERGLKQCQLAKLAGVHHSGLSMLENGYDRPSYQTAAKLAKVLKTTPEVLFPGKHLRGTPEPEDSEVKQ